MAVFTWKGCLRGRLVCGVTPSSLDAEECNLSVEGEKNKRRKEVEMECTLGKNILVAEEQSKLLLDRGEHIFVRSCRFINKGFYVRKALRGQRLGR